MKYLILLIIAVCLLSCQDENEEDIFISSLIAYFPLDSNYTDASRNEYHLQSYGSPEFVEGYRNEPSTAVLLDGEDDYFVGSISKLDTFSISMWLQSYRYFVGEWPHRQSTLFDYSNKQAYGYIDGISGATQIKCGIESEPLTGTEIDNTGDWIHVYMAVSNDVKIYLNGSLKITEPHLNTFTYLSDIIYFGRASTDDEIELTYFYGKLDEIRIFNRILDQADIDKLLVK
jgi:hypothetical protein